MERRGGSHRVYPLVRIEMLVRYKPEVPDPERADILERLRGHGYDSVTDASRAKFFQLKLSDTTLRKARADAKKIGTKLLANPVTENFEIRSVTPIQIG